MNKLVLASILLASPLAAYHCTAYCETFFRNTAICYDNGNIYPNHCTASCTNPDLIPQFVCELSSTLDIHLCSTRCKDNSNASLNKVFNHSKCNCPRIYNPVCGTNGFTFFNDCFRHCNKVNLKITGPCQPIKTCPVAIPRTFAEVCAGGLTYANAAIAGCAGQEKIVNNAC